MFTVSGENTVKCLGVFVKKKKKKHILICSAEYSAEIANTITQSQCLNFEPVCIIYKSTNLQIYRELTLNRGVANL